MLEKSSGNPESEEEGAVSIALEMRHSIHHLAGPNTDSDTREARISRAALAAGISFRQAKSLFYGETKDPKSSIVTRVRDAVARANHKAEANARDAAARTADVGELLARAVEVDADLRREVLALVLRKFAGAGFEDRPVD